MKTGSIRVVKQLTILVLAIIITLGGTACMFWKRDYTDEMMA